MKTIDEDEDGSITFRELFEAFIEYLSPYDPDNSITVEAIESKLREKKFRKIGQILDKE